MVAIVVDMIMEIMITIMDMGIVMDIHTPIHMRLNKDKVLKYKETQ